MDYWLLLGVAILLLLLFCWKQHKSKARNRSVKRIADRQDYNFELIARYFRYLESETSFFHVISDKTAQDIDVDELFMRIDRTSSRVGQQYLYAKLRTIKSVGQLHELNRLVEAFEKDTQAADSCKQLLYRLDTLDAYYLEELIRTAHVRPARIGFVYLLSSIFTLTLMLAFFYPILLIFLIPTYIINLVLHYRNKVKVSSYLIAMAQLGKAIKTARGLSKEAIVAEFFPNRNFLDDVGSIEKKARMLSVEKQLGSEPAMLVWFVFELVKVAFNVELILFHRFIDSITTKHESIHSLFRFIGELDAALSVASLRSEEALTCQPEFIDGKQLMVESLIHPLVGDCVSNSLDLQDESLLLTGSNMSGKTTFIRAVAVNSLLAQTIYTCFAQSYRAPFFRLQTSIRITDSLQESKSYYLEEVLTVKRFIEEANDEAPCLFVLDELFKGTNTVERIAAGKAVLAYLNRGKDMVLVSTHDIELTELLEKNRYALYHFRELVTDGTLSFDYKLQKGELKTRNAIKILELYGYPAQVVDDADRTKSLLQK